MIEKKYFILSRLFYIAWFCIALTQMLKLAEDTEIYDGGLYYFFNADRFDFSLFGIRYSYSNSGNFLFVFWITEVGLGGKTLGNTDMGGAGVQLFGLDGGISPGIAIFALIVIFLITIEMLVLCISAVLYLIRLTGRIMAHYRKSRLTGNPIYNSDMNHSGGRVFLNRMLSIYNLYRSKFLNNRSLTADGLNDMSVGGLGRIRMGRETAHGGATADGSGNRSGIIAKFAGTLILSEGAFVVYSIVFFYIIFPITLKSGGIFDGSYYFVISPGINFIFPILMLITDVLGIRLGKMGKMADKSRDPDIIIKQLINPNYDYRPIQKYPYPVLFIVSMIQFRSVFPIIYRNSEWARFFMLFSYKNTEVYIWGIRHGEFSEIYASSMGLFFPGYLIWIMALFAAYLMLLSSLKNQYLIVIKRNLRIVLFIEAIVLFYCIILMISYDGLPGFGIGGFIFIISGAFLYISWHYQRMFGKSIRLSVRRGG